MYVLISEDANMVQVCTYVLYFLYVPGCIIVGAERHFADVKGSYIFTLFFPPSFPASAASTRLHTFFVHVHCTHRRDRVSPSGTRN